MIEWIIRSCIRQRFWVCLLTVALALGALYAAQELPIDAVPDITNRQVQVNAVQAALSPVDMERRVTFPLETAVAGLPHLLSTRSISQFGLSQVTAVFDDDTDIYQARQWVTERLSEARSGLPDGTRLALAPVSTGLGEVLYLQVDNPRLTLMQRRTLADWMIRPLLRSVPGLADVNTWGGEVRQLQLQLQPEKLREFHLGLPEVIGAIANNNANGGGGSIQHGADQLVVSTLGVLRGAGDLGRVVVSERNHIPLLLSDLGTIQEGAALRQGAMTKDAQGEQVYLICLLLLGENGRAVVQRVKDRLPDIEKALPPGTHLRPFLDRSRLIDATLHTASHNLLEGGMLVIGVLFLFLFQLRAGLIVSCAIPLAMLVALVGMRLGHISANLMSLGAIDFGLVVDGAVIIVENCVRKLAEERERLARDLTEPERLEVIAQAACEVRRATQFGEILIMATYLPILSLQGIEGKMFRPMGWTVVFALAGAMLLSFTLIPALCAYFLQARGEHAHPLLDWLQPLYRRGLALVERRFWICAAGAAALVLVCACWLPRLGSEFLPELSEGDVALSMTYPPGISLREAVRQASALESLILRRFPDQVETVVTRIGRAEIATDPMLTNQQDVLIQLRSAPDQPRFVEQLSQALKGRRGIDIAFSQPIKVRMMELIEGSGSRADLGIKIFGPDSAVLARQGELVARCLKQVPGAADVVVESTLGQPQLRVELDRERMARLGVQVQAVNQAVAAAVGSEPISSINDGSQRYDVVVRLADRVRNDPEALSQLLVPSLDGALIALHQVADFRISDGPLQISRENGRRRLNVQCNVRGRDLGSFVAAVQSRLQAELHLPTGYTLEYSGSYEKLQSGRARLAVIVPLTFVLVFGLLYATFGSLRLAALVFSGIPLALCGGVLSLAARSMPVSISAALGFVALAGVAVLNGVVMVSFFEQLRQQGLSAAEAVRQGGQQRLRPVLMTAAVASFGFLPMALSQGAGAEVQRPLATVVIGGLLTSSLLTLLLLPACYERFGVQAAKGRRKGH